MKKLTRVEKKKRRKKIFLRLIFSMFFIFLVFILVFKTSFFLINNIKVTGNKKIPHKKIADMSDIEKKENIFKINLEESNKKIEKLPYVKEAKTRRKLPKSIIIQVLERKQALQIEGSSSFAIIDEEGYILEIVEKRNIDLPLLKGLEIGNKSEGDNFLSDIKEINYDFIREGQALKLLKDMEEIHILDNGEVNIFLFNGIEVVFGTIDSVKYKLNLLNQVLKDIEEKELDCKMILMNRGENPIIVLEDEEG